jgi:hypothetical protein
MTVGAGVLDAVADRHPGDLPAAAWHEQWVHWHQTCRTLFERSPEDRVQGALGQSRLVFGGPAECDAWTIVDSYGPDDDRFVITRVFAAADPEDGVRNGVIVFVSPELCDVTAQCFERAGDRMEPAIGEPEWGLMNGGGAVTLSACLDPASVLAVVEAALTVLWVRIHSAVV